MVTCATQAGQQRAQWYVMPCRGLAATTELAPRSLPVRGKFSLDFFMQHVVQYFNAYAAAGPEPSQKLAREMDGALLSVGTLYDVLKKKAKYKENLESMLVQYVLPVFRSPYGHLRAKACWVSGMYCGIAFKEKNHFELLLQGKPKRGLHIALQTFGACYEKGDKSASSSSPPLHCLRQLWMSSGQSVFNALQDPELPVRMDAVVSVRHFVDALEDATPLKPILPQLLHQFFQLMNEVENEDLVMTLESIVEKFGDDIAPYAVGLCQNLNVAFWKIIEQEDDDDGDDDLDTSVLAAYGCLRAITTVLESMSSLTDLYPQLEEILFPLMYKMCSTEGQEVFEEIIEIISYFTYFSPKISPKMWTLWPLLHQVICENMTEADMIPACKLMEIVMQNCRGKVNDQ
eukprot:scaffold404857_cov51-Prasinocladus_malaysianus.AAC.1